MIERIKLLKGCVQFTITDKVWKDSLVKKLMKVRRFWNQAINPGSFAAIKLLQSKYNKLMYFPAAIAGKNRKFL
jgi:hypothetical protein